jgi:nucleotide-binding universal stress UspA family protein
MQRFRSMAGNPFSILVAVKVDDPEDLALRDALELAARTPGSHLHAVTVVEPIADVIPRTHERRDAAVAEAVAKLQKLVEDAIEEMTIREQRSPPIARVQVHGEYGHAAQAIVLLADLLEADTVVVGMKQHRGVKGFLIGTVAEHVMRHAGCMVLVARPKTTDLGPHVEPVCPDCLARRQATAGTENWCARHSEHHPRAHGFAYEGASFDGAQPWGFSEPPKGAS